MKGNITMRRRRRNPDSLGYDLGRGGIRVRYSQEDKNRFRDYIKTRAMNAYGDAVDEEKLDNRIENELLWRLERNYDIADMDELRHAYDDVTSFHEDILYSSGPRSMSRRPVRDRSRRNPDHVVDLENRRRDIEFDKLLGAASFGPADPLEQAAENLMNAVEDYCRVRAMPNPRRRMRLKRYY